MRHTLLAGVSAVALGFAAPAMAGNIILTGHDNDLHCDGGVGTASACAMVGVETNWVRNGSTLPVLAIDDGSELTRALTAEGIAFTAVTVNAVTGGMFDHSKYSAFAVASVTSCGGCDNPGGTGTKLAAFNTSIAAFFDAGGGIYGLTGAGDPNAFAYVPEAGGTTTAIFADSGFVATPTGTSGIPGFTAVNGDETHNTFAGFSPFYKVAETYGTGAGAPAVTIFGSGAITCTGTKCHVHATPEPASLSLLGVGLFGLGLAARRRRQNAA